MSDEREIDALIAEKVFGRTHLVGAMVPDFFIHRGEPEAQQEVWTSSDHREWWCRSCGTLPSFSSDIAAAWTIVEKMRERGFSCELYVCLDGNKATFKHVESIVAHAIALDPRDGGMPLAICRAALKALPDEQ